MMDTFDVLLVDLQDLGCRIYTFITTLRYVLEAAARHGKAVWVLDRPEPGRPPGRRAAAARRLGELRRRRAAADAPRPDAGRARRAGSCARCSSTSTTEVDRDGGLAARRRRPATAGRSASAPGSTPAPTRRTSAMARCYAGTVMLEGTTLSEGRGTTRPLELFGAPDIDARALLAKMRALAPQWLRGCRLRACWFEPTFHKHAGKLCAGVQIHVEDPAYDHDVPPVAACWRSPSRRSGAIRPDYPLWRDFPYEYESTRLAIDLINGGRRCANGSTTRPRRPRRPRRAGAARRDRMAVQGVSR